MKRQLFVVLAASLLASPLSAAGKNPIVFIETSSGNIKIELFADKAPLTVKNFLRYVEEKFYDGTVFHRVARNPAVIQGGGFDVEMKEKKTKAAIKNEAGNNLSNKPFTIAMARTSEPDSATSQFYINVKDNDFLDKTKDPDNVGYCVFGRVLEGGNVVEKIWNVKTTKDEVPQKTVLIKSIHVIEK